MTTAHCHHTYHYLAQTGLVDVEGPAAGPGQGPGVQVGQSNCQPSAQLTIT